VAPDELLRARTFIRKIIGLLLALALLALLPARSACHAYPDRVGEHLGDLLGALLQTRTVGAKTEPPASSELT